jgi:hypothetical protein
MPANNYLPDVLETTEAEHLATGFIFTEGPLWHRRAIGISSTSGRTSCFAICGRTRHRKYGPFLPPIVK